MALSRTSSRSSPSAPPSHEEPEDVRFDPFRPRHGDELSFYKALARHTIGDAEYFESILHAVLTHYWRVVVDKNNPYHAVYKEFEAIEFKPTTTKFFGALSSPDFWLCPSGWQNGSPYILRVVTDALNIKVVLWGIDETMLWEDGPVDFPEYHFKFPDNTRNKRTKSCSALTPANDGRALINFLEDERRRLEIEPDENALKIRRIVWWRDPVEDEASSVSSSSSDSSSDSWGVPKKKERIPNIAQRDPTWQCYNEYAPVSLH